MSLSALFDPDIAPFNGESAASLVAARITDPKDLDAFLIATQKVVDKNNLERYLDPDSPQHPSLTQNNQLWQEVARS